VESAGLGKDLRKENAGKDSLSSGGADEKRAASSTVDYKKKLLKKTKAVKVGTSRLVLCGGEGASRKELPGTGGDIKKPHHWPATLRRAPE